MKSLKQIATLTALTGALCIPMLAMAEPMPPQGTTVNTIPLTTLETNMRGSNGQMMPSMNSGMNNSMNTTSGAQMGSMSSNMHGSMNNSSMPSNNMGTPMTSDMNMSDSDTDTEVPVTSPQNTAP
jgi:hypothetical protein